MSWESEGSTPPSSFKMKVGQRNLKGSDLKASQPLSVRYV